MRSRDPQQVQVIGLGFPVRRKTRPSHFCPIPADTHRPQSFGMSLVPLDFHARNYLDSLDSNAWGQVKMDTGTSELRAALSGCRRVSAGVSPGPTSCGELRSSATACETVSAEHSSRSDMGMLSPTEALSRKQSWSSPGASTGFVEIHAARGRDAGMEWVWEAKRASESPHLGERQAKLYADYLEQMTG